jgi:hypothetical protein
MKRQITGLHAADRCAADQIPDGLFLVRVATVYFRRQAQKPYYTLGLTILEPADSPTTSFPAALLQPESLVEVELVLARFRLRR